MEVGKGVEAGGKQAKDLEINDIGSEPPHPDLVISQGPQREENHLYTDP